MNNLEERLTDAYHAVAEAVRSEDIPDVPRPGPRQHAMSIRPRWAGLLVPLGAAAAVAVLVVAATALVPRHQGKVSAQPRPRSAASTTPAAPASPLPEFTVLAAGSVLTVADTTSGRVTGTVSAPPGQDFVAIAGTPDDKTFLVAADLQPQTSCEPFLYKFSLTGGGQPSALTALAVSLPHGGLPTALAVSDDGSTAAISEVQCATGNGKISGGQPIGAVRLVVLGSGQVTRTWSYTLSMDYPSDLSLSADGSLLTFSTYVTDSETVAWVLATSTPSEPAATAGRIVVRQPAGRYAGVDSTAIGADGRTLYVCTHSGASADQISTTIAAYDASDGHLERVLHTWPAVKDLTCDLAGNPAGGHLLMTMNQLAAVTLTIEVSTGDVARLPLPLRTRSAEGDFAW